jgi:hypothetical protein
MKATKITQKELFSIASTLDAVGFDAWCDKNKIDVTWLDVTLTDFNDGYYNVELPEYSLEVSYYDGVLESFFETEFTEN